MNPPETINAARGSLHRLVMLLICKIALILLSSALEQTQEIWVSASASNTPDLSTLHRLDHALQLIFGGRLSVHEAMILRVGVLKHVGC
jgi:hypothetical protein